MFLLFLLSLFSFISLVTLGDQSVQVVINSDPDAATPDYSPRYLGGSQYSTRFPDVTWNNQDWTLTTSTVRPNDFRAVAFTSNGYFGHSFASNGPFVQRFGNLSGWPLFNERQTFGTVSGFFDCQARTTKDNYPWLAQYGWDSAISGVPSWGPVVLELEDGTYLDANTSTDQLSNVALSQDYKQGLAKWEYTWTPSKDRNLSFDIAYIAFADKLMINRGYVQLSVTASSDANVSLVNVLDGAGALRADFRGSAMDSGGIYASFSPINVPNVTAHVCAFMDGVDASSAYNVSNKPYIIDGNTSVAQGFNMSLKGGQRTTVTKFVGVASSDAFSDPASTATGAAQRGLADGFEASLKRHAAEWAVVMPPTSVPSYADPQTGLLPATPALIEKTVTNVASIFALLMNTVSQNATQAASGASADLRTNSLSIGGLTSDAYAGQRFWDAELWMQPYLLSVFPFEAQQITNLRVQQYPQAKENIKTAYQSSKNDTKFSDNSAIYPWTSGRTANCTATGPCWDYEYHINGDIARSFVTTWAASGDDSYFKDSLLEPMQSIASLFSELLMKNGSKYSVTNMTDPDEYANMVDNAGFTMALIADTLNKTNWFSQYLGQARVADLDDKAASVNIPKEGLISLEYDSMNGSIEVKQADVVLKIYPLGFPEYTLEEQTTDLDYYAGKQSSNGPGMTYAIFSIDASDVSPSGCSCYSYDLWSWSPYLRAPWFLFSEQLLDDYDQNGGTNPAFPFLTGHGGYLQVDLYGYLGLRYSTGFTLAVNPTLPPQIPNLAYPVFHFQGWPLQAVANKTHTTITRLSTPVTNANMTYASTAMAIQVGTGGGNGTLHMVPPGGNLTLPNRPFVYNKTVPGNIGQCRPVSSPDAYEPGQFPIAAVDGAVSTVWQPSLANTSQRITVDLTDVPFQPLREVQFDWAGQPPENATVILHNGSCPETSAGRVVVSLTNITIGNPFDAEKANLVQPYQSNATVLPMNGTFSGNYATLEIVGNQNSSDSTMGATVAEFALVGAI